MLSPTFLAVSLFLLSQSGANASPYAQYPVALGSCGVGYNLAALPASDRADVGSHAPPTHFETFGEGLDIASSLMQADFPATAVAVVRDRLQLGDGEVSFTSGYTTETGDYAYLAQTYNDIPFVNAVANVALKDGKIIAFGSSFVQPARIASPYATISVAKSIEVAEVAFGGSYNGIPVKTEYYANPDGSAVLVHSLQIRNEDKGVWLEAYINAHSGDVVGSTSYVAHAGYQTVPIDERSIADGYGFIKNPQDESVSPFGWHKDKKDAAQYNETSGNNVVAYNGVKTRTAKQSGDGLVFDYKFDPSKDPVDSLDAAITGGFYIANAIHDVTYRYGFTEKAFNFQNNNFGKGGKENDRVELHAQNGKGTNNAAFATPPDGQSGQCSMYLWDRTKPRRDGDLDNTILAHEMMHGVSNRMTGGGTAKCLGPNPESRALGEGWSDAFANWLTQNTADVREYVAGAYATGIEKGIRQYPYTTDAKTNPLHYANLPEKLKLGGPHGGGEVWANTLHNVYAALVKEHGYSSKYLTDADGKEGNIVYFHLVIDGLAIQPCFPTFLTARDAIVQADQNRYKGANKCVIWKAFASRGLGVDAIAYKNSFAVPADCK